MKTLIKDTIKGNYNISLVSEDVTLANGTTYTEYRLSRLHRTRISSVGDITKTYKNLNTAIKNFDFYAN